MTGGLVVFLGPSLPATEARALARCTLLPPARQGDVWRALALRPAALALVDGVFESVPSVWHHELLDALDAGVAVFGGGSMGALRAAELERHGMVGVGGIFRAYRDGTLRGDDEVALLHGDADSGYRPLTVPLVTVRAVAERARHGRILGRREAAALVAAAAAMPYPRRTWTRVLAAVAPRLRPGARGGLEALVRAGGCDPKADDARATIVAAAAFAAAAAHRPGSSLPPPRRRPSSLVRRRKLLAADTAVGRARVASARVLERLRAAPDAAALRDAGLRLAVLAEIARGLGLAPDSAARDVATRALVAGRRGAARDAFLAASGLDAADAARLVEDLALERALLREASRAVADGPSDDEGLAAGARLAGRWRQVALRLARGSRRRARGRSP